jgi:hypothetical protein
MAKHSAEGKGQCGLQPAQANQVGSNMRGSISRSQYMYGWLTVCTKYRPKFILMGF